MRSKLALTLIILLLAVPAVHLQASTVVLSDHWLYGAFAELFHDGLLPGYPAELIGTGRELTRFELAYHLKGLLESLDAQRQTGQFEGCSERHVELLEKCIAELRRELLALGVAVRSLDDLERLHRYAGNKPDNDYVSYSHLAGDSHASGTTQAPYLFTTMLPVSYGLRETIQFMRAYDPEEADYDFAHAQDMTVLPGITLFTLDGKPEPVADVGQNWADTLPDSAAIAASLRAGNKAGLIQERLLKSRLNPATSWVITAGSGAGLGLAASAALMHDAFAARNIFEAGNAGVEQGYLVWPHISQPGTAELNMSLEIGRFLITTNPAFESVFPGLAGGTYGSLGLRTRYEYERSGVASSDALAATVALEGRFVLGPYATVYGGYGYGAVRQSVAEQFSLSQSLTSAGLNVRLSPNLRLFAEYVILSPSSVVYATQATLGLSHEEIGSFLFGYRLLSLGESQLMASFSLRF